VVHSDARILIPTPVFFAFESDIILVMGNTHKKSKRTAEIVLRDGKPSAVILDINEYQRMLERLEDLDDLKTLRKMREKPLKFRSLDDFLKEFEA
jgi:PHD/YefM family antitoxin component YafN of YafNO toxin-antitoxin module